MRNRRGHTLVELLVSMLLSSVALAVVTRDFGFYVQTRSKMDLLAETQQAASASVTLLTQELRQAGACLPELGTFISLGGEENGTRDSLILRIGIADPITLQCTRTILSERARTNESVMQVETIEGFATGQLLYLITATGHGNFFRIASISGKSITIDGTFDVNYNRNSGVYALEERIYEIAESGGTSSLTVAVDGRDAEPMVRGITELDIQYKMAPCPPCDSVDIPADDYQWRVVREVEIAVTARASRPGANGEPLEIENRATVKPRNFL